MDSLEKANAIGKAVGVLGYHTRAENNAGLFSRNRILEDVLLPLFRILFDAPKLKNMNRAGLVEPDIDLADESSGLAIQVTSERGTVKITDTLKGFIKRGRQKTYQRLVFFILSDDLVKPRAPTVALWHRIVGTELAFNCDRDVFCTTDLLARIIERSASDIDRIHDLLEHSVVGAKFVDVEAHLREQSRNQLNIELNSTKYIPDVFVETRHLKYMARCFAHPKLFLPRVFEDVARLNVEGFNQLVAESGVRGVRIAAVPELGVTRGLEVAFGSAAAYETHLDALQEALGPFETIGEAGSVTQEDPTKSYIFEEKKYSIRDAAYFLKRRLGDRRDELNAARSRIFVLTGRAGQGKTNFVCDFVDRFLWRHDIPTAHLSGRRLSLLRGVDLKDGIRHALSGGEDITFTRLAENLVSIGESRGVPAIVIVDGLNENIGEGFADELRYMLEATRVYPAIKFLLTCRSEFFDERFGDLFRGQFASETVIVEASISYERPEQQAQLIGGYFNFFKVDETRVPRSVSETLVKDVLLLRFFCEAYGARGKKAGYQQPYVHSVYRDQIFGLYLAEKLISGAKALGAVKGRAVQLTGKSKLWTVLELIVGHMVKTWRFSDVPRAVVSDALEDALIALLDEDVVLRLDTPSVEPFQANRDVLNFTFDEMRDYLLARYLVDKVFASDPAQFESAIAQGTPADTQSLEGVKRFLFYESRQPSKRVFFELYSKRAWYGDVYDSELFGIDAALLDAGDYHAVEEALRTGEDRAVYFARQLAVRWHTGAHPTLNLDMLLRFLFTCSEEEYAAVVGRAFAPRGYGEDGLAAQFSRLVNERLLPALAEGLESGADSVCRLLALILPVGADRLMDGDSVRALSELAKRRPAYAVDVLKWALGARATQHRAHVWRMLSLLGDAAFRDEGLRKLAQVDASLGTGYREMVREAEWYLERATKATHGVRP